MRAYFSLSFLLLALITFTNAQLLGGLLGGNPPAAASQATTHHSSSTHGKKHSHPNNQKAAASPSASGLDGILGGLLGSPSPSSSSSGGILGGIIGAGASSSIPPTSTFNTTLPTSNVTLHNSTNSQIQSSTPPAYTGPITSTSIAIIAVVPTTSPTSQTAGASPDQALIGGSWASMFFALALVAAVANLF